MAGESDRVFRRRRRTGRCLHGGETGGEKQAEGEGAEGGDSHTAEDALCAAARQAPRRARDAGKKVAIGGQIFFPKKVEFYS